MKILVTGATGSIGRALVVRLREAGHEIFPLSRHSEPPCDIRSSAVFRFVQETKPNIIIHLAANPNVPFSENNPDIDLETNVLGTLNLIEAGMKRNPIPHFVFASSVQVYGSQGGLLSEKTVPNPNNPYGIGKFAAEMYVQWYGIKKGLPYTILRICNVYGPGQKNGVIPGLIKKVKNAEASEKIPVNPNETRDFLYIHDLTDFLMKLVSKQSLNRAVLVGSGVETRIASLPEIIGSALGKNVEVEYNSNSLSPSFFKCDVTEARRSYDWQPKTTLLDGIREMIQK